tara:strand:- start:563 stop:1870 length:1308 start_codon:yes stop_codon:yes gene_type:complete
VTKNIYINILLVFLCLYTFLIGIKGLSKAIEGISSPDEIFTGDQVQLKKISIIESNQEITLKKQWVEVTTEPDEDGNFSYIFRQTNEQTGLIDVFEGQGNIKDKKKVASKWFLEATNSAFICLFIGIFATVIFQSSSTTTSLIVAMAGGGIIDISSAIPMVMGANIGTTVTNTLISVGHIAKGEEFKRAFAAATVHDFFNLMAVLIFFPLEMIFGMFQKMANSLAIFFFKGDFDVEFQSPVKAAVKWGVTQFKDFVHIISDNDWVLLIFSGALTLLMLFSIVKLLKNMVLEKVEAFFDKYIFKTAIRAMAFGVALTILVQSSSITTSTIVPLAGAGVLTLRQIFPFTLGANIGTTVTALLAAMVLNPTAMIVAFSHLIFNILGIITIYPIKFLREIPINAATKLAELSVKNKLIPMLYLLVVFVLIPIFIILAGG